MQAAQIVRQQPVASGPAAPPAAPAGKPSTEAFQRLAMAGVRSLYSPPVVRGIVGRISASTDRPADEISDLAVIVMSKLLRKARRNVPRRVIMPVALAITGMILEIGDAAALLKRDPGIMQEASSLTNQEMLLNRHSHRSRAPLEQ